MAKEKATAPPSEDPLAATATVEHTEGPLNGLPDHARKPSKLRGTDQKYFDTSRYQDKPDLLRVFQPFADLAELVADLPHNREQEMALHYLLLAKDAAVRAALD